MPLPNGDAFDVDCEKLFPNTVAAVVEVCAKPPPPPPPPKADDPKIVPAVDCCGEPKLVDPPKSEPPDVGLAAALPPNIEPPLDCTVLFANGIFYVILAPQFD